MLLSPGPVEVPRCVLAAGAAPMLHHRSAEFGRLLRSAAADVRGLVASTGTLMLYAGSGTLAMESAVANLCAPGDNVIVCKTGIFADRFCEMISSRGAHATVVAAQPGAAIDPAVLRAALAAAPAVTIVFAQHVDTSTGVRNDIAALAFAARNAGALVVVDAVASAGTEVIWTDRWGIDVLITASQKGLMCPPGLSMLLVSDSAMRAAEGIEHHDVYTSWVRRPPTDGLMCNFTAPVGLVRCLGAATAALARYDYAELSHAHQKDAAATRSGLEYLGFGILADASARASFVTVAEPPQGASAERLRQILQQRGVTVARGNGNVVRLGHYLLNRRLDPPAVVHAVGDALTELVPSSGRLVEAAAKLTAQSLGPERPPRLD